MKPVIDILEEKISAAMRAATGLADCVGLVRPSTDPKFGDYQANGVMPLAKKIKTDPRKLAEEVVKSLDVDDICEPPEIAGPGFINLRLKADFLADRLLEINTDSQNRLGLDKTTQPKTIVVDFSGPNIAKQMHVGHLRSTIIGDCICRILEFLGHKVIRQNHIGDWGTQFGMLVHHLYEQASFLKEDKKVDTIGEAVEKIHISDLETFYRDSKEQFDLDPVFKKQARKRVVELHNHDNPLTLQIWQHIVDESRNHYQPIYDLLRVNLHKENECGESFYADKLADVVTDLQKAGLAEESEGAICVFSEGFKNKQGEPLPLIVQKSDGAFLYATTDLAAIRYRIDKLKADKIIYVTDARQSLHFQMVFATARKAGWAKGVDLQHVTFGSVLGENGKPLKTREGENVKLKDLLNEAIEAVKYADYSNSRTSDYIFSFDKMLAMEGNTAPYMQYAYARIKSIERKAQSRAVDIETELSGLKTPNLTESAELDLAKCLVRYVEAIEAAAADYRPNYMTAYLYELAQKFSGFYTNCPVLDARPDKRPTRLLLCDLTARAIKHGLSELLGIEVLEQM